MNELLEVKSQLEVSTLLEIQHMVTKCNYCNGRVVLFQPFLRFNAAAVTPKA